MTRILPARPDLEHLRKQAKRLARGLREGDATARARYAAALNHAAPVTPRLADAQFAIAREYGFASWARLKRHVETKPAEAPVAELVEAVRRGDVGGTRASLAAHPALRDRLDDPLPGLAFGGTLLLAALRHDDRALVEVLLDAGADINQRSHWWAGSFGVLDRETPLLEYLVGRGVRVDAYAASRHGWLERLERLVAADPSQARMRGGDGQTPLHVAANVEVAEFLLAHGAEIDAIDVDHESTPAQYLVREHPEVARLLVRRGCRTDLLLAAALGDRALVERHLDADPGCIRMSVDERWFPMQDPNAGGTIYIWTLGAHKNAHAVARDGGHAEVMGLLRERSPDTLRLAVACEEGDDATIARLLAADPALAKRLDVDERARLVAVAQTGNHAALHRMLVAGWPVDAHGELGDTALHWTCWHGETEAVRELLAHGAPVEARESRFGMTPIGWMVHGSFNSWRRERGDYAAVARAMLAAGAIVPEGLREQPMIDGLRKVLSGA